MPILGDVQEEGEDVEADEDTVEAELTIAAESPKTDQPLT